MKCEIRISKREKNSDSEIVFPVFNITFDKNITYRRINESLLEYLNNPICWYTLSNTLHIKVDFENLKEMYQILFKIDRNYLFSLIKDALIKSLGAQI